MAIYRYSEWDGTQDIFELDADDLMRHLERYLMPYGDLSYALRALQRGGITDSQGRRLPSLEDLLNRLRQRRQQQLDKYNLGSILDDIRKRLENIVKTEREGISRRLEEARQQAQEGPAELSQEERERLLQALEERATRNLEKLDNLPQDIGGQIRELSQYDFIDDNARQQFQELMDLLKKCAMQPYAKNLMQQLRNLQPGDMAAIRQLLQAINEMLEQRLRGEEPDYQQFLRRFGHLLGPQPPQSLDELIEYLQEQIRQAQSLLDSMSPEDRQALEQLLESVIDDATRRELQRLSANIQALNPDFPLHQRYLFSGEEPISYTEALKLMEMLHKMDRLEAQLEDARYSRSTDAISEELVKELLGEQAARELEQLRNITRVLEEAGYIQQNEYGYELTPRGIRKIGQKALQDIFEKLKKDALGAHNLRRKGTGGERTGETRRYQFGDEFNIHIQKTVMNSLYREPKVPPLKVAPEDFEVFETEALTRSATVLMLDLSLSMPMRGNFEAAKRVAIALDSLIRSQFPRDILHTIGFSTYARLIKKDELLYISWDEFDPYTNMQQGLALARHLLGKVRAANKQVILITDGEPTAHIENGRLFLQYPPSLRTLQLTLREAQRCARAGIVINTFMLDTYQLYTAFVDQMAKVGKGRVFFTSADKLGQYVLVDYVANKRRRV